MADIVKKGSSGAAVTELQQFLIDNGYELPKFGADGKFGNETLAAVKKFQKDSGLAVDGLVGPKTQAAIDSYQTTATTADTNIQVNDAGLVNANVPGVGSDTVQPEAAVPATNPEGASTPGIMAGGTIQLVNNPDQDDYYIVGYEYPPGTGNKFYYKFDSVDSLEQAAGPNLGGGKIAIGTPINESQLGEWVNAGNASEITGVTGSFQAYMDDITRSVAADAGLGDPSRVGAALADPEIQLIMAKAAEGKWSGPQMKAAMRKTNYYKDVAYPGIEKFYASSDNPEQAYDTYLRNITNTAKQLGIPKGADGSYRETAGQMLDAGVSDVAFASFAPIYQRAQANANYAAALNKWTEKFTGKQVNTFSDWYDVLAGTAPADVQQVAEAAGLQYIADNAGFDITDTQLRTLAGAVDLTEQQANQVFSQTARSLLSLGERGLARGGLTAQDVLNAEAGFGGNVEKIKLKVNKLAREEGLVDDPSAKFYTDYNQSGAPIKSGLRPTIQEGA